MAHKTLWLFAALMAGFAIGGCSEDESLKQVFWNECTSDTDCANGARCLATNGGQRVCVVVENPGMFVDGEVFDPTGLKICGTTEGSQFCSYDEICCEGVCTAVNADTNNCGACGNVCDSNEQCSDGQCLCGVEQIECSSDEVCCESSDGLVCTSTNTDRDNCGGCGNVCASGEANESCLGGQCGCLQNTDGRDIIELCASGEACCPARVGADPNEARGCVDLNTTEDCGACGNQCGEGEQCIDGQCSCGQARPETPDGLGPVCGEAEACCFSPNGQQTCRQAPDCACGDTRCIGTQLCCFVANPVNIADIIPTCIDPTNDINNCGGCLIPEQGATPNLTFRCDPGQLCTRNFEYSLGRPPEEQNAEGIYIGQCALACRRNTVQCPGGSDESGNPIPQDQQSCIDPLQSPEFCGASIRRDDTSIAGQCSVENPVTFGEFRNFQGVRCNPNQICFAKIFCANPEPAPGTDDNGQPCDPNTHYYFDVVNDPDAEFLDGGLLPDTAIFNPTTDPTAYIQNPYLTAVCTTP